MQDVVGTFGKAFLPQTQRLKNQSLHHEILLLQKFTDISRKVLKPKRNQPPTSEIKLGRLLVLT